LSFACWRFGGARGFDIFNALRINKKPVSQFWNGRADTLKDQAAQPPLNPVEMAMPSNWAVVTRIKEKPRYNKLFKTVYAIDLDQIPAYELAPAGETPPPGVFVPPMTQWQKRLANLKKAAFLTASIQNLIS